MRLFSIAPNENKYDVIMFDRNNTPRVLFVVDSTNDANYIKNILEDIYAEAIMDAIQNLKSCLSK